MLFRTVSPINKTHQHPPKRKKRHGAQEEWDGPESRGCFVMYQLFYTSHRQQKLSIWTTVMIDVRPDTEMSVVYTCPHINH